MAGFGGIYCFDFFPGSIWREDVFGSFTVSLFAASGVVPFQSALHLGGRLVFGSF